MVKPTNRCIKCGNPISEKAIAFCGQCAGGMLSSIVGKVGKKGLIKMADEALTNVKADLKKRGLETE